MSNCKPITFSIAEIKPVIDKRKNKNFLPIKKYNIKINVPRNNSNFLQSGWPVILSKHGKRIFFLENVQEVELPPPNIYNNRINLWWYAPQSTIETTFSITVPLNVNISANELIIPLNQYDRGFENQEIMNYALHI